MKEFIKIILGRKTTSEKETQLREKQSRAFKTEAESAEFRERVLSDYGLGDIRLAYIDRAGRKILQVNRDEFRTLLKKYQPKEILAKQGKIFDEGASAEFLFVLPDGMWIEVWDLMPADGVSVLEESGLHYQEINPSTRSTESERRELYYGAHKFVLE